MAAADGGVDGQPADDNSVLPEHSASQIGDEAKPADAIQKALDCIKAESSIAKAKVEPATKTTGLTVEALAQLQQQQRELENERAGTTTVFTVAGLGGVPIVGNNPGAIRGGCRSR